MVAKQRTRNSFLLGLVALAFVLGSAPVHASDLAQAKSSGELGERYDGYLGVVKSSAASKALAADINAKRKAHYAKIAAKNGATVEATAGVAGSKLVEGASPGHYVKRSANADWQRVP